jgi:hypothetical protein
MTGVPPAASNANNLKAGPIFGTFGNSDEISSEPIWRAAQHGRQRPWPLASRPEQSPLRGTLQCPLQIARLTVVDRSALAQLLEPPYTDPYVRWCGRGGAARLPPPGRFVRRSHLLYLRPRPSRQTTQKQLVAAHALRCRAQAEFPAAGPVRQAERRRQQMRRSVFLVSGAGERQPGSRRGPARGYHHALFPRHGKFCNVQSRAPNGTAKQGKKETHHA